MEAPTLAPLVRKTQNLFLDLQEIDEMTNEDLSKLDFPLATMKMLESTTAMLLTVLHNQKVIMQALNIGTFEGLSANVTMLLQQNVALVNDDLKRLVPEGQYIKYPKN